MNQCASATHEETGTTASSTGRSKRPKNVAEWIEWDRTQLRRTPSIGGARRCTKQDVGRRGAVVSGVAGHHPTLEEVSPTPMTIAVDGSSKM